MIIGDTPADVDCGRALGARAIAVATGRYEVEELRSHGPAAVFQDLSDTTAVVTPSCATEHVARPGAREDGHGGGFPSHGAAGAGAGAPPCRCGGSGGGGRTAATRPDGALLIPDDGAVAITLARRPAGRARHRERAHPPASVVLHPTRGEPLMLEPRREDQAAPLLDFARRLERLTIALPELTRGLRAVGARRGSPGTNTTGFSPRSSRPASVRSAPTTGARGWTRSRRRACSAPPGVSSPRRRRLRYPESAPDRRALAAALGECAAPLHTALDELERAESAVRRVGRHATAGALARLAGGAARCFVAADRCWLDAAPVLGRAHRARAERRAANARAGGRAPRGQP